MALQQADHEEQRRNIGAESEQQQRPRNRHAEVHQTSKAASSKLLPP
jgi:hypothetical protein